MSCDICKGSGKILLLNKFVECDCVTSKESVVIGNSLDEYGLYYVNSSVLEKNELEVKISGTSGKLYGFYTITKDGEKIILYEVNKPHYLTSWDEYTFTIRIDYD